VNDRASARWTFLGAIGEQDRLFAFAGHTDWCARPCGTVGNPAVRAGKSATGFLYGRGAADMKGSLAAMITACEQFLAAYPHPRGSIAFLITSDEEGVAVNGTVKVVERLEARGEKIRWCLVANRPAQLNSAIPSRTVGAARSTALVLRGIQGHVAYSHRAQKSHPRHRRDPDHPHDEIWDQGHEYFPPTSFQISNLRSGTGADNVIPGDLEMLFNFRFSPAVTVDSFKKVPG